MKLEGELAFFHSKVGREPESQSFEFNDNDQNSAGYKFQNQKVKGYENTGLKKNEQGFSPSPYDMGSALRMATPELGFYDSVIDLKKDRDAQVIGFGKPKSHSSEDMESFMKFPNDKEPVKKSPISPISNPLKYGNPFEDSVDVYMDKTVRECEPELVLCYKASNHHDVKDICVDEVVLTKHKVMSENSVPEKAYNSFHSESFDNKEKQKDNNGINVLNLPATGDSDQVSAYHDQLKDLMHRDEDVNKNLIGNANKEMALPEHKVDFGTQDSLPSDDKDKQVSGESDLHSQSEGSKNMVEEAALGSATPALVIAADELNSGCMVLESGSLTHQFDPSASVDCGKKEFHQVGVCKCNETQQTSFPVEWQSDDQAVTCQAHCSLGESSFSTVGAVSSRISYSGSVPYSGSISHRSDSSATSTRSFAFPVLQSEWNSSPVRMTKADQSHYRKHRGWRQGLLCCRF